VSFSGIGVANLKEIQDRFGLWTGWWRWFGQFHYWRIQGDYRIITLLHIRFLGISFGFIW
jgi:hypothetical protein